MREPHVFSEELLGAHEPLMLVRGERAVGAARLAQRQAKHYKNDANNIYYSKSKWVEVSPIESRVSLVEKSHLLGHFQSNSRYNRLRENYYWYKMVNDVEDVVKN